MVLGIELRLLGSHNSVYLLSFLAGPHCFSLSQTVSVFGLLVNSYLKLLWIFVYCAFLVFVFCIFCLFWVSFLLY